MTWSPAAGLNVVSVERRRAGLDDHLGQPANGRLSGMWCTVQITSLYLLAHAAGPIRPRSFGCYQRSPWALEVSKPAVRSPHFH